MDLPLVIDELLERYLVLLDEYITLRESLSAAQSNIFHNIARANFAAERGLRFGQDHYDERTQATRRLEVVPSGSSGSAQFSVRLIRPEADASLSEDAGDEAEADDSPEEMSEKPKAQQHPQPGPRDPLQWFGILTPMPLRIAQTQAIKVVEETVPRLASVNAEMEAMEIEVRRARKKRAKAEAQESKQVHGDRVGSTCNELSA